MLYSLGACPTSFQVIRGAVRINWVTPFHLQKEVLLVTHRQDVPYGVLLYQLFIKPLSHLAG